MKNTFLVGYYGMQNTGDDALMNVSAWGAQRFLHTDVTINTPHPVQLYSGEKKPSVLVEKQSFPAQNRLRQYSTAMESDGIIFGGGSVLHNSRDINLKRHLMALSNGRKHLALGIGIGPFTDVNAEKACRKFLNECHFVGVRDKASLEIAEAIAPNANVELSFDLAPLMLQTENFELASLERKGIAICLCPKERLLGDIEAEKNRLEKIAASLDLIQGLTGEMIYFVDFNGHQDLGDRAEHQEVASYLSESTRYQMVDYDANPYRVLQRMASYKLAISMRLHASVFGFLTETPVISLNYHSKCNAWCHQTGMPIAHILDATEFDPGALVNLATDGLEHGFEQNELTVNMAVQAAMKNWRPTYEYSKQTSVFGCHTSL